MEKIYILTKDGKYEEASTLDEAIKETIKNNELRESKSGCNGSVSEDEGEAGELAPDEVYPRGTE